MHQHLVPPGIRFDDYVFSEPRHISQFVHPQCAGIVAVLARNPNWAPKPFEPYCFEEFGNGAHQLVLSAQAAASADLYVSVLALPFSTASERRILRDHLIRSYNPAGQGHGFASAPELQRKLDQLERKSEEQTNQLQLLVAMLNKLFEPQPVPPRRPIGFLAEPLPDTPASDY